MEGKAGAVAHYGWNLAQSARCRHLSRYGRREEHLGHPTAVASNRLNRRGGAGQGREGALSTLLPLAGRLQRTIPGPSYLELVIETI